MVAPWTIDATPDTFDQTVFEASHQRPVVVDFWAAWCQPCLMLKPVLESLAAANDGRFQLVKADTDRLQHQAMQFGVQSIPAVFAVVDAEIVDGFQGALSKPEVEAWLGRVLQTADLSRARRLENSHPPEALQLYDRLLQGEEALAPALIGKGRLLLAAGDRDGSAAILQRLEQRGYLEEEAKDLQAAWDLASQADSTDLEALRAQCEQQPDNLSIRVDLAKALAGAGRYQESLDLLLEVVAAEKSGAGEAARLAMLEVFRVLPDDSELTRDYRRKLSSLLF